MVNSLLTCLQLVLYWNDLIVVKFSREGESRDSYTISHRYFPSPYSCFIVRNIMLDHQCDGLSSRRYQEIAGKAPYPSRRYEV